MHPRRPLVMVRAYFGVALRQVFKASPSCRHVNALAMSGFAVSKRSSGMAGYLKIRTLLLHGEPIISPGSVIGNTVKCGNNKCKLRAEQMASDAGESDMHRPRLAQETLAMEWKRCRDERLKRVLVARSSEDPRFQSQKFAVAPAVLFSKSRPQV